MSIKPARLWRQQFFLRNPKGIRPPYLDGESPGSRLLRQHKKQLAQDEVAKLGKLEKEGITPSQWLREQAGGLERR